MSAELRALVRATADEYVDADPRELARHVAKATPDESVMDFYTEALVDMVRYVLGAERQSLLNRGKGGGGFSPKVRDRADWWADLRRHVLRAASTGPLGLLLPRVGSVFSATRTRQAAPPGQSKRPLCSSARRRCDSSSQSKTNGRPSRPYG